LGVEGDLPLLLLEEYHRKYATRALAAKPPTINCVCLFDGLILIQTGFLKRI
jgi:hypothetical protein